MSKWSEIRSNYFDDEEGNRYDPEACKHHSPIKSKEKAYPHQRDGNNRADQFRDPVAGCRLDLSAVPHDICRQISNILFTEVGQRELPEFFGKRGPSHSALSVCSEKSCIILDKIGQGDQCQYDDRSDHIERNPVPGQRSLQKVLDQAVKNRRRHHQNDVRHGNADARLYHIHSALP